MPVKLPQAITSGWPNAVPANPASRQAPIAADKRRRGCFMMAMVKGNHSACHTMARRDSTNVGALFRRVSLGEAVARVGDGVLAAGRHGDFEEIGRAVGGGSQ